MSVVAIGLQTPYATTEVQSCTCIDVYWIYSRGYKNAPFAVRFAILSMISNVFFLLYMFISVFDKKDTIYYYTYNWVYYEYNMNVSDLTITYVVYWIIRQTLKWRHIARRLYIFVRDTELIAALHLFFHNIEWSAMLFLKRYSYFFTGSWYIYIYMV
jgi:hypothetical protein